MNSCGKSRFLGPGGRGTRNISAGAGSPWPMSRRLPPRRRSLHLLEQPLLYLVTGPRLSCTHRRLSRAARGHSRDAENGTRTVGPVRATGHRRATISRRACPRRARGAGPAKAVVAPSPSPTGPSRRRRAARLGGIDRVGLASRVVMLQGPAEDSVRAPGLGETVP